jgi:hypothetical protein
LTDVTNKADADASEKSKKGPVRERRERGPPADGIPSKNKVMVANLPYDLTEETVRIWTALYSLVLRDNMLTVGNQ